MSEFNWKHDRVPANNWFSRDSALRELDAICFAVSALSEQCGTVGSNEREMARNAYLGIRKRIDYLHDSLKRIIPTTKETLDSAFSRSGRINSDETVRDVARADQATG